MVPVVRLWCLMSRLECLPFTQDGSERSLTTRLQQQTKQGELILHHNMLIRYLGAAVQEHTELCRCAELGWRLEWQVLLCETDIYHVHDRVKHNNALFKTASGVPAWDGGLCSGNAANGRMDSDRARAKQADRIELQHKVKKEQTASKHHT
jgi:hypothetical protein